MVARTLVLVAVTIVLASAGPAQAAPRTVGLTGFELGLRTGYAFSSGRLGSLPGGTDQDLADYVSGQWPIWIDLGYRFRPSFYLGGFFQYGFGFVNDDQQRECRNTNVDCSASDIRAGIMARYNFLPAALASPWLGYGLGWEWGTYSIHQSAIGSSNTDFTWSGFELANFQLGVDFRIVRRVVLGPFISWSLGQYQNETVTTKTGTLTTTSDQDLARQSLHEWIFVGVRVAVIP